MYSYSGTVPGVARYDAKNWLVPYGIEEITVGEGEETIQQYRCQHLLLDHQPSDDDVRTAIATQLRKDVGAYIYSHYDAGTQSSLNGLLAKRSTSDAIRDAIDTVVTWIETVLGYYYGKKAAIYAAANPETVVWEFNQFDGSDPNVTLSGFVSGS
jgi:hypothetical protein